MTYSEPSNRKFNKISAGRISVRLFSSRRVSALRGGFSREVEALHKAVELGRADVAAYHRALVDENIRLHRSAVSLIAGIIFYIVCPALCALSRIRRQVEVLRFLNLIVFFISPVEFGGDYNFCDLDRVLLDIPAELRQKRRALLGVRRFETYRVVADRGLAAIYQQHHRRHGEHRRERSQGNFQL